MRVIADTKGLQKLIKSLVAVSNSASLAQRKQARESGDTKLKGKPQAKAKPAAKAGKGSPPGSKPTTAQSNKKGSPSSGKGQKSEIIEKTGFVLDGFPSTLEQAEILERNLTGLDLTFSAQHAAHASVIAPPPPTVSTKICALVAMKLVVTMYKNSNIPCCSSLSRRLFQD